MKSATLAILLSCFALTSLATATNTVDFSNGGGTLSGTNAGLTLSGSTLIAVIGLNGGGMVTGDLGTVSFTTGALASGSLEMGGTLAAGGMFSINGNGTNGIPNGVLFSGTFSAPNHLDSHHPGKWDSQLHADRCFDRNDGRNQRECRYGSTDRQHRYRILQRLGLDCWRRYHRSVCSGTLHARFFRDRSDEHDGHDA